MLLCHDGEISSCVLLIYLFSRLFDVSTSSCAHLTIILSSSSIYLWHSSLLPLIPFPPNSPLIPSAQVALGLPRFLLPGGLHFITFFGSLPSSILWRCPHHFSCLVLISWFWLLLLLRDVAGGEGGSLNSNNNQSHWWWDLTIVT